MDLAQLKTTYNEAEHRFELQIEGQLARIDVKEGSKRRLYLIHTEVPEALGNRGVGHKMVREALNWVEENHLKLIPLCPFVRAYVKQNLDDYKDILDEGAKL